MKRIRNLKAELLLEHAASTQTLGYQLGKACQMGDILALTGPLGAGKTCLTQGIALGFGVPLDQYPVTSPTFGLLHEYPGRLTLYHMDFYRLVEADLAHLGLDDILEGDGVCVVEWPERTKDIANLAHVWIELSHEKNMRRVKIETSEQRFLSAFMEKKAIC